MQQIDLYTMYVILFEMMGVLLWILVALAVFGIAGFIFVYIKEGQIVSRRLLLSELAGFFGGFLALVIMAKVTVSGFTDAGGPIDWLLIVFIWGLGLVGITILAYTITGLKSVYRRA